MIYFGKKWLTADLYKELAYEGETCTPEKINATLHQLETSKIEVLTKASKELDA